MGDRLFLAKRRRVDLDVPEDFFLVRVQGRAVVVHFQQNSAAGTRILLIDNKQGIPGSRAAPGNFREISFPVGSMLLVIFSGLAELVAAPGAEDCRFAVGPLLHIQRIVDLHARLPAVARRSARIFSRSVAVSSGRASPVFGSSTTP